MRAAYSSGTKHVSFFARADHGPRTVRLCRQLGTLSPRSADAVDRSRELHGCASAQRSLRVVRARQAASPRSSWTCATTRPSAFAAARLALDTRALRLRGAVLLCILETQ